VAATIEGSPTPEPLAVPRPLLQRRLQLAALIAAAWLPAAAAQPPGWECRSLDAAGQCLGLSHYTEPGGTRLSGLRSGLEGRSGWSGQVIRRYPDGSRRECQADTAGRCEGATTHWSREGLREDGTMTVRNGVPVWTGLQTTTFADGSRLECRVAPEGLCDGAATLRRADGELLEGRLVPRGRGHAWQGRLRRQYANGDREDCEADPAGRCQGATVYTYADGTRLVGSKRVQGDRSTWSGSVEQHFPSGRHMRCETRRDSLCAEDTQLPVDREGRPLATLPR